MLPGHMIFWGSIEVGAIESIFGIADQGRKWDLTRWRAWENGLLLGFRSLR
jgi:hypothetical protein